MHVTIVNIKRIYVIARFCDINVSKIMSLTRTPFYCFTWFHKIDVLFRPEILLFHILAERV